MRGKATHTGALFTVYKGSPPPMRGKVECPSCLQFVRRITPAYAGKSPCSHALKNLRKDHPRLCGEKLAFYHLLSTILGSPPPMRGKEQEDTRKNQRFRITPAYAGKSPSAATFPRGCRDHPRLCGEKLCYYEIIAAAKGSPPPMRGKVKLASLQ